MLRVEAARARVLAAVEPTAPIDVALNDALGSVAARDLRAPESLPRFDNSSMDGYAVLASDVTEATSESPVSLRIVDESRAGRPADVAVEKGTAIRIMTGAPLPTGADSIVIVEDTDEEGSEVQVRAPSQDFIRRAGEDVEAGDVVVPAGTPLDAGALAMLAACGRSVVSVHRRPRVAVLVTGDELVDPEREPGPGQIRDSNSIALDALVSDVGGEVIFSARVPDNLDDAVELFEKASRGVDLIISSGGVAVGRYDVVRAVVEKLGSIDLWRVAMQPGKPVVLGRIGAVPFLGLPGNPVSVHVCFEQFARPALRKMLGYKRLLRPVMKARLSESIQKKPGRQHFVRVRLSWEGESLVATPTGPQGSHIQSSLVACDGVAIFPIESEALERNAQVEVEVWELPPHPSA